MNTEDSKTRDDALNKIIEKMNSSLFYEPIAYILEQSGCSCCLSESFYLLCKIKEDYKLFQYDAYINHTNKCAMIRCTCGSPFIWKNIEPKEINFVKYPEEYFISNSIAIQNNNWIDEYQQYIIQKKENDEITKYNENISEDYENDTNKNLKNYYYYFRK